MKRKCEWVSRREAGRRLRVSAVMVGRYVGMGLPTRPDKCVPWPAAREWVRDNVRRRKPSNGVRRNGGDLSVPLSVTVPVQDDDLPPLSVSARRKESALARLRELELKQKGGELVEAATVRDWMAHMLRPMVASLRHLPAELRDEMGVMRPAEFEALLLSRIDAVLSATVAYLDECTTRAGKPLSDGALPCGPYQVVWRVEPIGEEPQ